MEKKYLKVITGLIGLTTLVPLASCSTQKQEEKKQEEAKLASIEIVECIDQITLEVNNSYTSNPIQTKAYDSNKKEMSYEPNLVLVPVEGSGLNVCIENKRLVVKAGTKEGTYKYNVVAMNDDGSICSTPKEVTITVYTTLVEPDQIELNGIMVASFYAPSSNFGELNLVAKKDGKEITNYNPACDIDFKLKSYPFKGVDDIGEPIFYIKQNDKKFELSTSSHLSDSYNGTYYVDVTVSLKTNPSLSVSTTVKINMTYGLTYRDTTNNVIYSRPTLDDEWEVLCMNGITKFDGSNLIQDMYGHTLNKIAQRFCYNSNITKLTYLKTPMRIKIIGEHAFESQEALAIMNIKYVETIKESAFYNCSSATTETTLPLNVKYIEDKGLSYCSSFSSRYFPNIISIGKQAMEHIGSSILEFGYNLEKIDVDAFKNCPNLEHIKIAANTPPKIYGNIITDCPKSITFHVPASSLQNYLNDPNWQIYSNKIVGDYSPSF